MAELRILASLKRAGQRRVFRALVPLALGLLPLACGPELDPISRLETLRIIGIQKSEPYARPGETIELSLLYEDMRASSAPIETFFAFWCVNPPGGAVGECLSSPPSGDVEPYIVLGESNFSLTIPDDILRPSPSDPEFPDSGSAVVFSGVCAGELSSVFLDDEGVNELREAEALPAQALLPRCLDKDGQDVGAEDFVIAYSTVLVYEELRNENPIIKGLKVEGKKVAVDCIDQECDGPFELPELDGCEEGVACIKACKDDGDFVTCPPIRLSVIVDPESAERDDLAKVAYDRDLEESIWVSYFVDRGSISPELKLVNDAAVGFQDDFSTRIYAPKEPGPMGIWAAVRDNRGGISWLRVPAYVKK